MQPTEPTTNRKRYQVTHNVGSAHYCVTYHDGQKTHPDGSPFWDMVLFKSKVRMNGYLAILRKEGYTEGELPPSPPAPEPASLSPTVPRDSPLYQAALTRRLAALAAREIAEQEQRAETRRQHAELLEAAIIPKLEALGIAWDTDHFWTAHTFDNQDRATYEFMGYRFSLGHSSDHWKPLVWVVACPACGEEHRKPVHRAEDLADPQPLASHHCDSGWCEEHERPLELSEKGECSLCRDEQVSRAKPAPQAPAEPSGDGPTLSRAELNTVIAALRYYQNNGMENPGVRKTWAEWLHEIATDGLPDGDPGLNSHQIDTLADRINETGLSWTLTP